jgi:hypothetical protein
VDHLDATYLNVFYLFQRYELTAYGTSAAAPLQAKNQPDQDEGNILIRTLDNPQQ